MTAEGGKVFVDVSKPLSVMNGVVMNFGPLL